MFERYVKDREWSLELWDQIEASQEIDSLPHGFGDFKKALQIYNKYYGDLGGNNRKVLFLAELYLVWAEQVREFEKLTKEKNK
jgi:hypothetical protein